MPGGDRTGPNGMGPMTGRAAGLCAGFNTPGYLSPGQGYGAGFRRGRRFGGRGGGWRGGFRGGQQRFRARTLPERMRSDSYNAPYEYADQYRESDPELEKKALKNQESDLQSQLDFIKKRLDELDNQASKT